MWRSLHNLPLTAQSFRDSQDKSFAFHGASSAAWAKAPAVPLDWPISAVASAIDRGRPAGRWPACRPFHRSGDAVAEIAGEEGASEPTADSRRPAKRFSRGQSRVPEPRGAHAAQRRMRHRPAAPPGAWVGLAAEPAEAGGRPPIGEPLLRGPAGGLDGGVVARAAPRGRGASGRRAPPAGRRCRGSRTRRRRIRICPDSVDGFCAAFGRLSSLGQSAPSSSAGPRRPSAERVPALSQIASMRPNGSGAAPSRAGRARASAPASRCPCATGARFPSGRLNGATSPGERERGAGPRRRP